MKNWITKKLGDICDIQIGGTPSRNNSTYWDYDKATENLWVSIKDLNKKNIIQTEEQISDLGIQHSNAKLVSKGTVLLSFKLTIGKVSFAGRRLFTNEAIAGLINPKVNSQFLYFGLQHWDLLKDVDQAIKGATLNKEKLKRIEIVFPEHPVEQNIIAEILSTVDEAIDQTEKLIEKQQRIKRGLLHNLLTKGIDENSVIRSEATHEFKDSPLGRIPKEWQICTLEQIIKSAIDGPFGSNLKTEHYVNEPGVRVVRLQNIAEGYFDDSDKAYVSTEHAQRLKRHQIISGDLIIASMGDSNHPIARACLYPLGFHPGIVKADCFRVRLKEAMALNAYVKYVLNCESTREDINILGQGVTRDRVNLTKLKQVRLRKPGLAEQEKIVRIIDAIQQEIEREQDRQEKFKLIKKGLIQDLLTGKVPVDKLLTETNNSLVSHSPQS